MGLDVNNDIFADNAWYFRNALVRYVYKNSAGILPEPKYLERFFRNLLLGEQHELLNRYLIINPPEEWKDQSAQAAPDPTSTLQAPYKYPTSTGADNRTSTEQALNKFFAENENILRLVSQMGEEQWKVADLLKAIGLKDRQSFNNVYLTPAMKEGFVRMLYPDSPRHPRQRYLLTVKGIGLYNSHKK